MKTKLFKTQKLALVGLLGVTATSFSSQEAHAYDMDCKVILCIAGGFPSECSDAWRYMIKRITRLPKPLPPFGFCAMSNGSEYKAHNVNYSFLGNGPQAYDCPEGKQLYYRREETDRGGSWGNENRFLLHKHDPHTYRLGPRRELARSLSRSIRGAANQFSAEHCY